MTIDIIDIQGGNVQSIRNWAQRLDIRTRVIKNPNELKSKFIVLPGVGSIGPYMDRLKNSNFDQAIIDHLNNGHRLLGICLGLQIMGSHSREDGGVECLGLINGYTERLKVGFSHNGWEKFSLDKNNLKSQSLNSKMKLTRKKITKGRVFFNHEYGFINEDEGTFSLPISQNLDKYSSIIIKGNIIGVQFHPEKSQQTGLDLLSLIL
jgi:imidazole glycerol-phosphate synthase subunit HisH|tara:strand:- start:67 stop:687 length:621 start_codon:yes stop_codon:yes gene_type:complete